jgi:Fic family protein
MLSYDSIMRPPYVIDARILDLLVRIGIQLGAVNAAHLERPSPMLRRRNRIRTIHSTLAIEGNTLSEDQVTAVLEGRRVLAKPSELLEVTNAVTAYERLSSFRSARPADLLKAHGLLMKGLVPDAGRFRTRGVGVLRGRSLAHLAPPASSVPTHVTALLSYVEHDADPMLIKSCVLHYELEFIHPFSDGNGRMGRLWQTRALMEVSPVFTYLPVEALVRESQRAYYAALAASDASASATPFIVYMLERIEQALTELSKAPRAVLDGSDRMLRFIAGHRDRSFARKDYMQVFPELSSATASRDLRDAVAGGWLVRAGNGRIAQYKATAKGLKAGTIFPA